LNSPIIIFSRSACAEASEKKRKTAAMDIVVWEYFVLESESEAACFMSSAPAPTRNHPETSKVLPTPLAKTTLLTGFQF
jgi:hypothetical protein